MKKITVPVRFFKKYLKRKRFSGDQYKVVKQELYHINI